MSGRPSELAMQISADLVAGNAFTLSERQVASLSPYERLVLDKTAAKYRRTLEYNPDTGALSALSQHKELTQRELVQWGYAPGNYMGTCRDCSDRFMNLDKRAWRCERCAMIARYTEAEQKLAALDYHSA